MTDTDLPAMDFSLTIVSQAGHVPPVWLSCAYEFFAEHGICAFLALERGGKNENLHIQAVVTMHAMTTKDAIERMKKALKEALGVKRGDGKLRLVNAGDRRTFEKKLKPDAKVILLLAALGEDVPVETVRCALHD